MSEVASRVKPVLQEFAERSGYAYVGRIKTQESLVEKIESGRFAGWDTLDDLFACALILPSVAHEAGVLEFLQAQYDVVEVRRRGRSQKDPAVFRFDTTRFIGRLRQAALPEDSGVLTNVKFEIQVRTAFEHAWSVTTHDLTYKGERVDWRRMRLVAQLRAAIEQLDSLVAGFDGIAESIYDQAWPDVVAQKRIEAFFRSRFASGALPDEHLPLSWVRFTENIYQLVRGCHQGSRTELPTAVENALNTMEAALARLSAADIPRSVSLVQLALGVLATAEFATGHLQRYTPLVTDELLSLFPDVARVTDGFEFGQAQPGA